MGVTHRPSTTFSIHTRRGFAARWGLAAVLVLIAAGAWPSDAAAQVTAKARPGATTPPWFKGILPISPESYYNAIECGKQGGDDPPCVFWDTGLCQNDDFTLAAYTGYKQVAYEVWLAVQRGQPAPEPNYQAARRTRVTISATPAEGSTNVLTDLILSRDGNPVSPVDRSRRDGRYTFDYPAWAPTGAVTLEMVGEARTISCVIEPAVLQQFR
ncbi:MAG: hypothetical protein CL477_14760 [Acidobacteria bacterium]|nr:hypothetical protein [Acidobacteriota bacterium]MDP7338414.1 hypothetical protein [Vicinamibacterales bacterium]